MAASIYATPPPDLSSEDTALSDVSNASSLNNRSSSNSNSNVTTNNNNSTSCNNTTTSNNNTTNSNPVANTQKRTINEVLASSASQANPSNPHTPKQSRSVSPKTSNGGSVTSAAITLEEPVDSTIRDEGTPEDDADMSTTPMTTDDGAAAAMAAMTAAANAAAMQLQFLEAINDAAKKRRKQNNPSRVGAQAAAAAAAAAALSLNEGSDGALINAAAEAIMADKDQFGGGSMTPTTLPIDYDDKLSKMFLPKSIEQLKETFELLQQKQQRFGNISPDTGAAGPEESFSSSQLVKPKTEIVSEMKTGNNEPVSDECSPKSHQLGEELTNPYQTFCKTCGENFETEFKLGLHMLQEHQNDETEYENTNRAVDEGQQKAELIPYDMLSSVNVKMERPDYENSTSPPDVNTAANQIENHNANLLSNGKEPWLNTMPGMGFPFPPEAAAAAALSAGGYLPLLGMPGFPTVDGMNRPPIRIFNPEAYCDLCNKEFCNKYFLKTHRANKHGIYDPAGSNGGEGGANTTGGNMSAMTQMLQLQMQQQQQQQSMQHLQQKQQMALEEAQKQQISSQQANNGASSQQLTPPAPPPVYCDVCSKRFTNVFAMRRHRAKAHDQQRRSPGESTILTPPPLQSSVPTSKSDTPTPVAQNESKHDLSKISSPTDSEAKQFQMPDGFRQDFTLEQEEVSFTPQPRKLSPQSQQQAREANFSHDKLRRLGVVNPEAFCEICCKEYCNKYFLRTHKWKRHGIFVPPDDLKDEQLQFAQKMAWPFMGLPGMPLNLMMANDKALMAQRMFAAATSSVSTAPNIGADDAPQHVAKRIKLEQDDEEVSKANDENQENKCLSGRQSAEQPQQQTGSHSVASTPEPQKILAESYNSGANMPTSPETAVGLQNLQKLQSMIQQLNDLNGKRTMGCHICGRDMENQYALQVHMMTDHAGLLEGSGALPLNFQQHLFQQQQQMQAQQQQQVLKHSPSGSPGVIPSLNEMRCNQCDRDFANIQEFKQHIAEVHLLPGSPLREGFATPERPINPNAASMGSRPPYTITPTSSYCEICNKELCNKYFMKTHMQRMHGIEIENGAQIGGVVCNICNKELCSKYFLRVHKQNTHGIVDESAPLPQPRQNGLSFDSQQQQQQQQLSSAETDLNRGLNLSPFASGNSGDSKSDYANYTEVCVICTRRFRSSKWLRAHLQSDHGTAGIEKLRELEQQYGPLSKSSSPTLKIPNGSANTGSNANNMNTATGALSNPANLAQALQNLNTQHLLGNMPKNILPGMFGAATEQSHSAPRLQEYQCSICPFTTPYYAFLFIHERSHTLLGGAGDLIATASGQLIPGSGIKDEINGSSETKSKSDSTNTPMTDKSTLLSIAQTNSMTTMECGRVEPTNLSTRSTTPSGSTSKSKPTKENQAQRSTKQIEAKESRKEVVTTKSFAHIKLEKTRTIATSPISTTTTNTFAQVALNDLAEKCGKVASYAVPKDVTGDGLEDGEPQMQAFVLEIQREREMDTMAEAASAAGSAEESSNRFVPAIVYLPVRKRISGPVTVSFNLTPA